jgi:hypothetical protein
MSARHHAAIGHGARHPGGACALAGDGFNWDAEYAYVIAATGWTWDYVDEWLTVPRLRALNRHWAKYPPVHVTAAIFAGAGSEATPAPTAVKVGNLHELPNGIAVGYPSDGVPVRVMKRPS